MTWHNWARTVRCEPARVVTPADAAEVADVLVRAASAGEQVKAVGSGHSFNAVAATDGVHVRLDRLSWIGALVVDPATGRARATVGAGTTLRALNTTLAARGFGLTNMGDIDAQTIAGAVATGTHGTGRDTAGLAAQVSGLQLALPDGSLAEVSEDDQAEHDAELFAAARLGLWRAGRRHRRHPRGRARLRPARRRGALDARRGAGALRRPRARGARGVLLAALHRRRPAQTRQPHRRAASPTPATAGVVGGRRRRERRARGRPAPHPSGSAHHRRGQRAGRPPDLSARLRRRRPEGLHQHQAGALPRDGVRTAARGGGRGAARVPRPQGRGPWRIAFPVEVRLAPADDVWLSTAHGRDTVYVATHAYPRTDYGGWFDAVEALWTSYDGRPHWGKLHTRDAAYLDRRYDHLADFRRVRDRVDPTRIMGNAYLRQVLGD